MDDEAHERVRIEVDVERRRPSSEERERYANALPATPNAIERPFEAVWTLRVSVVEPEQRAIVGGGASIPGHEDLLRIITAAKQAVSVELARRFSEREVALDPRFANLIGTRPDTIPSEVAAKIAKLLGLGKPTLAATEGLLVDIALIVHAWYDNPFAPTEATDAGHAIVSSALERVSGEDLEAILSDLGVEDDVRLWAVAADLLDRMGVPTW